MRTELPTTRVAADAPYHDTLPKGVSMSGFISSRAIEPFYDILEKLTAAGATISISEMDQDVGGPVGEKGWYGPGCNTIPARQDRTRYSLQELLVRVRWTRHQPQCYSEEQLSVTVLLSTLFHHLCDNGSINCLDEILHDDVVMTKQLVTKPLFFEMLKAYQTVEPDLTAQGLYNKIKDKTSELLSIYDTESYMDSSDDHWVCDHFDTDVFSVVQTTAADAVTQRTDGQLVLYQYNVLNRKANGKHNYHYTVSLQAFDLRANMDTLLKWNDKQDTTNEM